MPGKRSFDEQLAALEALRRETPAARLEPLRKALTHRNNYIVAKAADLVRELGLPELSPELIAAFDRFFTDPVKNDPQCWAKNAISRALSALDCQEAGVYLRGMRHTQPEPVWGGSSDTAVTLRATCALALVQCRALTEHQLLQHLIDLFGDKEKVVRVEAARAVGQVGSTQSALLLKLRSVLAGDEPEVLGACFSGILSIEGTSAIQWLRQFLETGDDISAEAALAIAQDRSSEAFEALRHSFERPSRDTKGVRPLHSWFQSVLLSAMALTRQGAATNFLMELVETSSMHAEEALEALLGSAPAPDIVERIDAIVQKSPNLARVLAKHRASPSKG